MVQLVLTLLKGWVTKELLLEVFKEVVLETTLDIVEDFAKDSANPYDDKLVSNLKEFLEK